MTRICEAFGCQAGEGNFTHWQGNEMACRASEDSTTFFSISYRCLAMALLADVGVYPVDVDELKKALGQRIPRQNDGQSEFYPEAVE
jgi:hypothetical protein